MRYYQEKSESEQEPKVSEHMEQRNFVSSFRKLYPKVLIFAIPNGGQRSILTASKLKLEGVTPGVPDLFIPEWLTWVEMKAVKGRLSDSQIKMFIELRRIGHTVLIGYGCADALEQIEKIAKEKMKNA